MGKFLSGIRTWVAAHRKTVTAVAGVAAIVVDDAVTGTAINWQTVVLALLAALGVYAFPNTPKATP